MIPISIVTISYNQAKFLETAIRSVLDQGYPWLEYIIVDPGSTDGSRDIIERYAGRLHKIIFDPDRGPADGLNKGFRFAAGEVFGYINADDILLPGALTKVSGYFQTCLDIDILLGNGVQLDNNGTVTRKLFSSNWDLRRYAYGVCVVVQQGNFFKSVAFNKAGGFNIENRISWDAELLVDMCMTGAKFMKVDDLLGGFRLYPESISGSGLFKTQSRMEQKRIFKKIMGRDFRWPDAVLRFFYRITRKSVLIGKQIIQRHPQWINEARSLFHRT
jgi:glycosyltransferase involved in cell wall biosynthesis